MRFRVVLIACSILLVVPLAATAAVFTYFDGEVRSESSAWPTSVRPIGFGPFGNGGSSFAEQEMRVISATGGGLTGSEDTHYYENTTWITFSVDVLTEVDLEVEVTSDGGRAGARLVSLTPQGYPFQSFLPASLCISNRADQPTCSRQPSELGPDVSLQQSVRLTLSPALRYALTLTSFAEDSATRFESGSAVASFTIVPEPSTALLLGMGLSVLGRPSLTRSSIGPGKSAPGMRFRTQQSCHPPRCRD